jgi:uncharacterized membrane protein YqaE (UPF0057 family)
MRAASNLLGVRERCLPEELFTMLYLIAVVLPPVAVLLCGKPFQALLSIPLTLLGWAPGVIHALFVVNNHYAEERNRHLIRAVERNRFAV